MPGSYQESPASKTFGSGLLKLGILLAAVAIVVAVGMRFGARSRPLGSVDAVERDAGLSRQTKGRTGTLALLRRYTKDLSQLSSLSTSELAIRLTWLTHNHCDSRQPRTGQKDINQLFDKCSTACGGYAYVLQELLAVFGVGSRSVHFYNMPNQGIHTAVEVMLEPNRWVFLDPTFGTYFTSSGSADDVLMSIHAVRFQLTPDSIENHVITAVRDSTHVIVDPLDKLYKAGTFSQPHMELENHLVARQVAPPGLNLLVPLRLQMDVSSGDAFFGKSIEKESELHRAEADFLAATNVILLNNDLEDDVSLHFSHRGRYSPYYKSLNVIEIVSLAREGVYHTELNGYNQHDGVTLQLAGLEGNLRFEELPIWMIAPGAFKLSSHFRTSGTKAHIAISRRDTLNAIRIVGVGIVRL
jgi:hypothetical protein